MLQSQKELVEIRPDGVLWNRSVASSSLLNDRREVTAVTVFHEYVEDAGISIDKLNKKMDGEHLVVVDVLGCFSLGHDIAQYFRGANLLGYS